jgi:hypothetical protein
VGLGRDGADALARGKNLEPFDRAGHHFDMEDGAGKPSRWNPLRAMRVLDWYSTRDERRRPGKRMGLHALARLVARPVPAWLKKGFDQRQLAKFCLSLISRP